MAHELTVKARSLLNQQASLELEFLETLNQILEKKIYAAEGYDSSTKYLMSALGLSGDSVWRRMHAADLLRRYPELLRPILMERAVHLTGLAMLHSVITDDNAEAVLHEACGKTKKEIELIVVRYAPRHVPKSFVQRVPPKETLTAAAPSLTLTASTQCSPLQSTAPVRSGRVDGAVEQQRLTSDIVRLHVNLDAETQALLERVRDIAPDRDVAAIVKAALADHLERLEKRRFRKIQKAEKVTAPARSARNSSVEVVDPERTPERARDLASVALDGRQIFVPADGVYVGPNDNKRYVDADTARFVYARDNYRCTFTSASGHVCGSSRDPQLHHRHSYAHGGPATRDNLTVHCRCHNLYQGELDFGRWTPKAA